MVVVESNLKIGKVTQMLRMAAGDELFRGDALLARTNHDGRAVGVVRADIHALVTAKFLEPCPKIGLQILHQMTEMDIPVRIGECACNYNLPFFRHICLLP